MTGIHYTAAEKIVEGWKESFAKETTEFWEKKVLAQEELDFIAANPGELDEGAFRQGMAALKK